MSQKKPKYYVVWKGRTTGVFTSWEECKTQIHGFEGAEYKSFTTQQQAVDAFTNNSSSYIGKPVEFASVLSEAELLFIGKPIEESIAVDGAWNTDTGIVEYQGVMVSNGEVLFKVGPYENGTNNIVEFLGLVHALAYCKQKNINLPIYSDSRTAISWVRKKDARTKHSPSENNKKLFELMERAVKWLKSNTYSNKILKWETKAWGENPADFGRK